MQKPLKFFTLLIVLCLSFNVYAQLAIGPKVGLNIATWDGDGFSDFADPTGISVFQFGVAAEIPVNDRVAIQPEFLYFQKGVGFEFEDSGVEVSSKFTLNYFEIPVLAKVILTNSSTQVFVTVGPSFGFGLDGKSVSEAGNEREEVDIDFDEEDVNKFDFSASLGAGVQFPLGSGKMFIDGRYLLGFSGLDVSEPEELRFDYKNRGIGFSAGFLFPIGG